MKRILDINKNLFLSNLRATQVYCEQQLRQRNRDDIAILRSLNPNYGEGMLFNYKSNEYSTLSGVIPPLICEWAPDIDPYDRELFGSLFEKQMSVKNVNTLLNDTDFKGNILVVEYDFNIPDGASAVESEGFVDELDFPPIDTWFFTAPSHREGRLLFSWVPEQYLELANKAIDVHFLDTIHRFEDWVPLDCQAIMNDE